MFAKKHRFIVMLALLWSACDTATPTLNTPPPTQELFLNIECCFDNDYLEIYADGQILFADSAYTWPSDGLASAQMITITQGVHRFSVEMNGTTEADSTFDTTGMKAIVVRYDTYDYERHIDIPLQLLILPVDYVPGYD